MQSRIARNVSISLLLDQPEGHDGEDNAENQFVGSLIRSGATARRRLHCATSR